MFCQFFSGLNNSHIFTLCLSRGMLAHILSNVQKHCEVDLIPTLGITEGLSEETAAAASCGGLEGDVLKTEIIFTLHPHMGLLKVNLLTCLRGPRAVSWHAQLAQGEGLQNDNKACREGLKLAVDEKKRFRHTTHISGIHTYKTRRRL